MGRFELIRSNIETLDGGTFQALATRYVSHKYHLESQHLLGIRPGSTKPAQGTPDAFYYSHRERGLIYLESGHVSGRDKASRKILGDITKCLADERSHLPEGELKRIVICYSESRLLPEKLSELRDIVDRIELISADDIAHACASSCPWLASEYLDVPPLSGALMDIEAFLKRNEKIATTTSLDRTLIGRDDELANLLAAISENRLVIISGPSGVGKTRLALEGAIVRSRENDSNVVVVGPTRTNIYEELAACCYGSGETLLFLDDANNLACLDDVIRLVLDKENLKVIITVRNYALAQVFEKADVLANQKVMKLAPLSDTIIDKILHDELGIANAWYRRQIISASKGNLRLAILAAERAKAEPREINNMHDLLQVCYGRKLEFLSPEEQKAIEIASALGPHRTNDNMNLSTLEEKIGLSHDEYKSACFSLREKELMDTLDGIEAVSFEEQNLRDYFTYAALIDRRDLKLSDIWPLVNGQALTIRCVNVLLNVFADDQTFEIVKRQVRELWRKLGDEESEEETRLHFVAQFNVLLGADGILHVGSVINSLPCTKRIEYLSKSHDNPAQGHELCCSAIDALLPYAHSSEHEEHAIELLINLLKKDNGPAEKIKVTFRERLIFDGTSEARGFARERLVLNRLMSAYRDTRDSTYAVLLTDCVGEILKDQVTRHGLTVDGKLQFANITLSGSKEFLNLRKVGIDMLLELRLDSRCRRIVDETLYGYSPYLSKGADNNLAHETCTMLIEGITATFEPHSLESFEHASRLKASCIRVGADASSLNAILSRSRVDRLLTAFLENGHRDIEQNESRIYSLAVPLDDNEWGELFHIIRSDKRCRNDIRHAAHSVTWGLGFVLCKMHEEGLLRPAIYEGYAQSGLEPLPSVAAALHSALGARGGRIRLLELVPEKAAGVWLACFDVFSTLSAEDFSCIEESIDDIVDYDEVLMLDAVLEIDRKYPSFYLRYLQKLAETSTEENPRFARSLPHNIEHLIKYETACSQESITLFKRLLSRFLHSLHPDSINKLLFIILHKDPAYISQAAILATQVHSDHFSLVFSDHIWTSENPLESFKEFASSIARLNPYDFNGWSRRNLVSIVLCKAKGEVRQAVIEWLAEQSSHDGNEGIFFLDVGSALPPTDREVFAVALCREGVSDDAFKRGALQLSCPGIASIGSEIPPISKDIERIESLKQRLSDEGFARYAMLAQQCRESLERYREHVSMEEFLDPLD